MKAIFSVVSLAMMATCLVLPLAENSVFAQAPTGPQGGAPPPAQQQQNPKHRGKEDEFLSQCVERPIVVVDRIDHVGGMPLVHTRFGNHIAIRAAIAAPGRQIQGCVTKQSEEHRAGNAENANPRPLSHDSGLSAAIAARFPGPLCVK